MLDLWAQNIADYRKQRRGGAGNARASMLEKNGVKFHDPSSADELDADPQGACRRTSPTLIKDAKLSPEIVSLVEESPIGSA